MNRRFVSAFSAIHYIATGKPRGFWSYRFQASNSPDAEADASEIFDFLDREGLGADIDIATARLIDQCRAGEISALGRPHGHLDRAVALMPHSSGAQPGLHEPVPSGAWLTCRVSLSKNELSLLLERHVEPVTLYSDLRIDLSKLQPQLLSDRSSQPISEPEWWPKPEVQLGTWSVTAEAEREAERRLRELGRPISAAAMGRELTAMWRQAGKTCGDGSIETLRRGK